MSRGETADVPGDGSARPPRNDDTRKPPVETEDLRAQLASFLDTPFPDPITGQSRPVGNFKWGVYAFFDYDGEPIYVGQTNEKLRTRIRRHLTNQRTDAVAMSVLDPFEVFEIAVWPLPHLQAEKASNADAKALLNALESAVYEDAIRSSKFGVVLNEKNPPAATVACDLATIPSHRARIVSDRVLAIRDHPDFRIARRALVIARLAQVIAERKVQVGLRRVLVTQAKRLEWLAQRRFTAMGGELAVPTEDEEGED
jgi:hypothetical protein